MGKHLTLVLTGDDGSSVPAQLASNAVKIWHKTSQNAYLGLATDRITQFLDLSGNGNHTDVQATTTKRALLDTINLLNGKQVAAPDNTDTYVTLSKSTLFALPNGSNTWFVVAKRSSESGSIDKMYHLSEAGSGRAYAQFSITSGTVAAQNRSTDANNASSTGNQNTNYQIVRVRRNGTTVAIAINGGAESSNLFGQDENGVDAMYLFSRADIDSYLDGGFAELIGCDRDLTASEKLQVELYLSAEWGIYHPYAPWLYAYTPDQQSLIHMRGINKDNAFTNVTANPFSAWYNADTLALGAVASWPDSNGKGNTAVQATPADQPVNTAATIGTKNALIFDGATDLLNAGSGASIDDLFAAGGTVYFVIKPTTIGETAGRIFDKSAAVLYLDSASGATCQLRFLKTHSSTNGIWHTTARDITLAGVNIIAVTYDASNVANNPILYVNSITAKAVTTAQTPVGTPSSDAASNLIIGNNAAQDRSFAGAIAEALFIPSIGTTAQRTAAFNCFATKYGVTLT